MIAWFVKTFPGVRIGVENAAIGATGSESAVFRVERDILERGCDLVFIEYAVNDSGDPTGARQRTREGLIRKCLDGASRDLVLVYTYMQDMYADMIQGRVPASIAEFERLGEHYGIGSVWMGLPFDAVTLDGPWTLRRSFTFGVSQALDTAAVGTRLSFAFEGRAITLGLDHGKASADFRYRLDDGEWLTMKLDRPVWCGSSGWYLFKTICGTKSSLLHEPKKTCLRCEPASAPKSWMRSKPIFVMSQRRSARAGSSDWRGWSGQSIGCVQNDPDSTQPGER